MGWWDERDIKDHKNSAFKKSHREAWREPVIKRKGEHNIYYVSVSWGYSSKSKENPAFFRNHDDDSTGVKSIVQHVHCDVHPIIVRTIASCPKWTWCRKLRTLRVNPEDVVVDALLEDGEDSSCLCLEAARTLVAGPMGRLGRLRWMGMKTLDRSS